MTDQNKTDKEVLDELYKISKIDYDTVLKSINDLDKKVLVMLGLVPLLIGVLTNFSNADTFDLSHFSLYQKISLGALGIVSIGSFIFSLWHSFRAFTSIDKWKIIDSAKAINDLQDKDSVYVKKQITGLWATYAKKNTKYTHEKGKHLTKSAWGYFIGTVTLIIFIILKNII